MGAASRAAYVLSCALMWLSLPNGAFAAGVGPLSNSKLSLHVGTPSDPPLFLAWLAAARPRVLKLLDPGAAFVASCRAASPGTLIIGRLYTAVQPTDGDPVVLARAWLNASVAAISAIDAAVFWEGYNEPAVADVTQMAWYAAFEVERIGLLHSIGRRAATGQFSTGTPDVTAAAIVHAFYPALAAAQRCGSILTLHEYASPTMSGCFDESSGEGWFTGRYRKLYREYLLPANLSVPLVVSEAGIDNSPCTGSPNFGGWQNYCSFWPAMQPPLPGPANCSAQYVYQLAWYDSLLRADSYVVGATVFCQGCVGWSSYDTAPILPPLLEYMQGLAL